jgi:hypothetical protein
MAVKNKAQKLLSPFLYPMPAKFSTAIRQRAARIKLFLGAASSLDLRWQHD